MNYTEYIKKYQNTPGPIVKIGATPISTTEEILLKAGLPETREFESYKDINQN